MDALCSWKVPVYTFPSRVWMRTFSPSALLGSMPPRAVSFSRPVSVIWVTIPPRVSVWASSSRAFASGCSGFRQTSTPPLRVRSGSRPRALSSSITRWAARSVKPVGLSMARSAQVCSTAYCTYLSISVLLFRARGTPLSILITVYHGGQAPAILSAGKGQISKTPSFFYFAVL